MKRRRKRKEVDNEEEKQGRNIRRKEDYENEK